MTGKPEVPLPPSHFPDLAGLLFSDAQQKALQWVLKQLAAGPEPDQELQLLEWQALLLHAQLQSEEALQVLHKARQQAEVLQEGDTEQRLIRKSIEVLQGLRRFEEARTLTWALLSRMGADRLDWDVLQDACATQILDTSLDHFLQVLPQQVQLTETQQALLYKDLGNVMCSLKRYPEGLRLFQLGLQVLPPDAPTGHRVDLLNGVGGVYTWTERFKEALMAYQENHRLYQQEQDEAGQIKQLVNMAMTLQSIPRPEEARQTLEQVIERAGALGLSHYVRQAHYLLAGIKGMPRLEAARHLLEYARLEVAWSESGKHEHEPLLLHTEVRQNQQNFDFQKSMRLELEGAYQKLYDLNEERQQLYERLEKQAEEFERLANTDPLTGLPNRRLFFTQFEREYARVRRSGENFSVVLMDIDHFKTINDTHSHKTGDLVLKIVADLLRLDRRMSDLAARYGGEEFVLLLPGADAAGARQACERIQRRLAQYPWQRLLGDRKVTMSFGISSQKDLENIDQVLMQADERLYAAKRAGRNCVVGEDTP